MFYKLVFNKLYGKYHVLTHEAYKRLLDPSSDFKLHFEEIKDLGFIEGSIDEESIIEDFKKIHGSKKHSFESVEMQSSTADATTNVTTSPFTTEFSTVVDDISKKGTTTKR